MTSCSMFGIYLNILVGGVFEVPTNSLCLIQVHSTRLLYLQVLEDNVVRGKVEIVEEEYWLDSDILEYFLDQRHRQRESYTAAKPFVVLTVMSHMLPPQTSTVILAK